jgi:hypothetical protein
MHPQAARQDMHDQSATCTKHMHDNTKHSGKIHMQNLDSRLTLTFGTNQQQTGMTDMEAPAAGRHKQTGEPAASTEEHMST